LNTKMEDVNVDEKIHVWLDCDPGHDDAFAIILAAHNPKLRLLGISTVAGNQTVEKTTINALHILDIIGMEHIDVVSGQAYPLVKKVQICPEIHGNTGLDSKSTITFPSLKKGPLKKKAVLHMFDVISQNPKQVTVIATGCLTNIAILLTLFPEVKTNIERIVIMGGAIGMGNMTPDAEFNILQDPEAAKIIFEAGMDLTMVPLEVTHTALVTPEVQIRIEKMKTKFSTLLIDLLNFFSTTYRDVFGFEYPPLHDPVAVFYCIQPTMFKTKLMRVDIEVSSLLTSGRTVCDIYNMKKMEPNVNVALGVEITKFWDTLIEALESANKVSKLNL